MVTAATAGMSAALTPWSGARAEGLCARVTAPQDLPEAWASAVADLQRQIAQLPAADCQPMTLSLEPRAGQMRVIAMTDDGRRAARVVGRAADLVPTALGLLMAIPGPPPLKPSAPVPPTGIGAP